MTLILALAVLAQENVVRDPLPDPTVEVARWRVAHGLPADPVATVAAAVKAILPEPAPTRADLEFLAAVEDFAKPGPPEPYCNLIARLGSTRYADREAASKALEAAVRRDRSATRWLFAGRRSKDPEIAVRSNAILRRLHPCPACKGAGNSKSWDLWPCSDCDGCGTEWAWSAWD